MKCCAINRKGAGSIPACLQSLNVKVWQRYKVSQSAASERNWLCLVWFTVLLVWVRRNGVGTRELWVNDRTLWSVPLTLRASEFQLLTSMNVMTMVQLDGRPAKFTSISPFPTTFRTYSIQQRPVRIQTRQRGNIASGDKNCWNGHEVCWS